MSRMVLDNAVLELTGMESLVLPPLPATTTVNSAQVQSIGMDPNVNLTTMELASVILATIGTILLNVASNSIDNI